MIEKKNHVKSLLKVLRTIQYNMLHLVCKTVNVFTFQLEMVNFIQCKTTKSTNMKANVNI